MKGMKIRWKEIIKISSAILIRVSIVGKGEKIACDLHI